MSFEILFLGSSFHLRVFLLLLHLHLLQEPPQLLQVQCQVLPLVRGVGRVVSWWRKKKNSEIKKVGNCKSLLQLSFPLNFSFRVPKSCNKTKVTAAIYITLPSVSSSLCAEKVKTFFSRHFGAVPAGKLPCRTMIWSGNTRGKKAFSFPTQYNACE